MQPLEAQKETMRHSKHAHAFSNTTSVGKLLHYSFSLVLQNEQINISILKFKLSSRQFSYTLHAVEMLHVES